MSAANETRWLDAQEQQVWAQLSTMILRLQPVLSAQLQREFGISQFEYLILARLSEAPGSKLRMSVLATTTGSSLPRLSQAVGRLEKRGWMSRQPDAEDSRYTVAVLSPAGLRQLQAHSCKSRPPAPVSVLADNGRAHRIWDHLAAGK